MTAADRLVGQVPTGRDTLIIIPTHAHPGCLPLAVGSVQAQTVEDLDIVVIGDGVTDDTRAAIAPILAGDERVRFLDLPKAPRHGEEYRDAVIRQSAASVVGYLGDDDLLLPHHVATMRDCLQGVDFANPFPVFIRRDGSIYLIATDLANPACVAWHINPRLPRNSVSLTGVTHTRASYLRLPYGWRPAPPGFPTDQYMWHQYFRLEGFTARTSTESTTLKFAQAERDDMSDAQRADELEFWARGLAAEGFAEIWNAEVTDGIRRAAVDYVLQLTDMELLAMDFAGLP